MFGYKELPESSLTLQERKNNCHRLQLYLFIIFGCYTTLTSSDIDDSPLTFTVPCRKTSTPPSEWPCCSQAGNSSPHDDASSLHTTLLQNHSGGGGESRTPVQGDLFCQHQRIHIHYISFLSFWQVPFTLRTVLRLHSGFGMKKTTTHFTLNQYRVQMFTFPTNINSFFKLCYLILCSHE